MPLLLLPPISVFGPSIDLSFRAEYARINFKTVRNNFNRSVWDNDMFSTTFLCIPIMVDYTSTRHVQTGKFWQSVPFAAGGSLMWELFMENEAPSINDFMATTPSEVQRLVK